MKDMTQPVAAGAPSKWIVRSTDTSLASATVHAETMADDTGLPQTVYRNENSGGWWHTNSLADLLRNADVFMTALPKRYFS